MNGYWNIPTLISKKIQLNVIHAECLLLIGFNQFLNLYLQISSHTAQLCEHTYTICSKSKLLVVQTEIIAVFSSF